MTRFTLATSRKLYEILGDFEAVKLIPLYKCTDDCMASGRCDHKQRLIPAPTFQEFLRVLPKIGEKKGWRTSMEGDSRILFLPVQMNYLAHIYMNAHTEEEGTRAVEAYIMKILV